MGTQIRKLAHAACLDGCKHVELAGMAKTGNYGKVPGNVHRDLMCRFVKNVCVPKKEKVLGSVFLPHIMLSELSKLDNFHELFPLEKVEQFWIEVEKAKDPRLQDHPCKSKNGKKRTIPIWLHGDGVENAVRDSLMCWSSGPLMTNFPPLETKFLTSCFPKSATAPETWGEIMQQLCWALNALVQGVHPIHDATGKPLKKGSPFLEQRGKPLCSGYKAIVWSIQGDAEFFANHLVLPPWGSLKACMECDCVSSNADESRWFKTIRMEKHTSNSKAAANPSSNFPLLHQVPGLTTKFVRGDALHIMWVHGIYSHLLGSVLHHLVYHDGPGRQKKPPQERLSLVWSGLQKAYDETQPTTRATNLKLSMFVGPKQPHSAPPALSLKGNESKHFLPAFLQVCKSLLKRDIWHESCMLDALQSMQQLVEVYNKADVPIAAENKNAFTFAKTVLGYLHFLRDWALQEGKLLFHVVHKFHTFQHRVEKSKFLNPKACCCFANEDHVAKMSQLVFSISPGVRSSKLCKKVGPKYRVLLHLLLTRDNFSLVPDE